jgi:hypothetical protein
MATNVKQRNFFCSQELDNGMFELHVLKAFHFDCTELGLWIAVGLGSVYLWWKGDIMWLDGTSFQYYIEKCDRGGKTFQPALIC